MAALTNAERQARYRAKNRSEINAARREAYARRKREAAAEAKRVRHLPTDFQHWARTCLVNPETGKPLELMDWQAQFATEALAAEIDEAGLTVARRNGKTWTQAAIAAALHDPRSPHYHEGCKTGYVLLTRAHAREALDHLDAILTDSDIEHTTRLTGAGWIDFPGKGKCKFFNASRRSGHGTGLDVAICDELGLYEVQARALVGAMCTSLTGRGDRFIANSVMGHSEMFREQKRRHVAGIGNTVWHEYAADPMDEVELRKANPGWGVTINVRTIPAQARAAAATPADLPTFRLLTMNAPGATEAEALVPLNVYRRACVEELPPRRGVCCLGIDFGSVGSLTAAAAFWPMTGRFEARAAVPMQPSLAERGRVDGVATA